MPACAYMYGGRTREGGTRGITIVCVQVYELFVGWCGVDICCKGRVDGGGVEDGGVDDRRREWRRGCGFTIAVSSGHQAVSKTAFDKYAIFLFVHVPYIDIVRHWQALQHMMLAFGCYEYSHVGLGLSTGGSSQMNVATWWTCSVSMESSMLPSEDGGRMGK